jgi:hypothetical protein
MAAGTSGSGLVETETGTLGSETGARGRADRGDTSGVGEGSDEETDGILGGATGTRVGGETGGWTARRRMSATRA